MQAKIDAVESSATTVAVTESGNAGPQRGRAGTLVNEAFASRTTALGLTGELRGAGRPIEIRAGESLDDIARNVNALSASTGVTAAVLTTGSNAFRLVLATRTAGPAPLEIEVEGRSPGENVRLPDRVDSLTVRLDRRHAQLLARITAMEQAFDLAHSQGAWLESKWRHIQQRGSGAPTGTADSEVPGGREGSS